MRTDGQKDMTRPILAFPNFVDAPNESPYILPVKNSLWYRHINRVRQYMP
jgi:hypothetical protein